MKEKGEKLQNTGVGKVLPHSCHPMQGARWLSNLTFVYWGERKTLCLAMSASTGLTSRGNVLSSDLHQFIPLEKLHSKEDTVKRLLHENSKQVSNWVFLSGWSEAVPPSLHSDGVVESLGFPKVPPLSLWSSLAPRETSASEALPWAQNLIYCPGHLF